ncbi:MAG: hypothetical protein RIE56_14815, partial [Amphiplicatus sp.]
MTFAKYFFSALAATAALAFVVSKATVSSPAEAAPAAVNAKAAQSLPHQQPKAAFPNTDDGLPIMQLGVGGGYEAPFINVIKDTSVNWNANGPGLPKLEIGAFAAGGGTDAAWMPRILPPGYKTVAGMPYRDGARTPALQPYYAGTWVIEWDGDARLAFGLINLKKVRVSHPSKNRIEGVFPPSGVKNASIVVNQLGSEFSNLRVYRKENEALLKAGKLIAPDFRAYASRYKVLRTLDLQAVNINWQRTADQFAPVDAPGWRPANFDKIKTGPRGFPPEPLFGMAVETDTALWMHFPGQAGAGPEFDADAIFENEDDGTTGDVKGALHSLSRAKAQEIIASPEWDKIAGRIAEALIASGYPEDRRFYLELSNEVWNFANPFWRGTHYFHGIGLGVSNGAQGFRYGYGYASARMAEAFEKALAERGRKQAWVPVIAGQMANANRSRIALEGYKAFFEERGVDSAPWLKIAGVSTASYYQGALHPTRGVVTAKAGETKEDAWLREVRSDPDGLAKRVADHFISGPVNKSGTLAWIVDRRKKNESAAKAFGAFLLGDYEGGDHDNPSPPAKLRKEPDYVNWVELYRYGPEGERVTRAWIEALRKQNPEAIIANYYGISAGDKEPDKTDTTLE